MENLERLVSVSQIQKKLRVAGINLSNYSIIWRIHKYEENPEKDKNGRILVERETASEIFHFYLKLKEGYSLSRIARDAGISPKKLYSRMRRMKIPAKIVGNKKIVEKREYQKWRIILLKERKIRERTISTPEAGKVLGIDYNMIRYYIKKGIILGIRSRRVYRVYKEEFYNRLEEWKKFSKI